MSTRDEDYGNTDRRSDGVVGEHAHERGYDRTGTEYDHVDMEPGVDEEDDQDDSVLVFEFLKRKRPLPSSRRLDLML